MEKEQKRPGTSGDYVALGFWYFHELLSVLTG